MSNTVRSLQEENQHLRHQIGELKDELKQKDMMIAALESQIAALVLVNRSGVAGEESYYEDDSETDADTLSRISSLGVGSSLSNQPHRATPHRNAPPPLPPRPPKAGAVASTTPTSSSTKTTVITAAAGHPNKRSLQQQYSSDDDDSNAPPPKPRTNSRLPPTYPPAPPHSCSPDQNSSSNHNNNLKEQLQPAKKNGKKKTTGSTCSSSNGTPNTATKESIESAYVPCNDEDGTKMANGRGKFKSDKAAIKALPRELSIYNNDDDDVTKYSVDDGQPTYLVEKCEFRDAYNVRGIFTGSIHRASGMPHGFGKMVYHLGGRYYEGDWFMGHWHGKGIFRNQEGDVYEGHMVNDLKEGTGKLMYADGRVFQGKFDDDEAVEGTIKFPDGARYEGQLHNGARHGYGVYHFNDGSVYEGESVMNVFEGKGKMIWNDGGWYEGKWSQGEIHGRGKEIRPDGSLRHDGQWSKGVPIRD
jgi:hypothetical protein